MARGRAATPAPGLGGLERASPRQLPQTQCAGIKTRVGQWGGGEAREERQSSRWPYAARLQGGDKGARAEEGQRMVWAGGARTCVERGD